MVTTVAVLVMDQVPTQKPAFVNDDFSKAIILSLMSFFIIPFDDDFSKLLLKNYQKRSNWKENASILQFVFSDTCIVFGSSAHHLSSSSSGVYVCNEGVSFALRLHFILFEVFLHKILLCTYFFQKEIFFFFVKMKLQKLYTYKYLSLNGNKLSDANPIF